MFAFSVGEDIRIFPSSPCWPSSSIKSPFEFQQWTINVWKVLSEAGKKACGWSSSDLVVPFRLKERFKAFKLIWGLPRCWSRSPRLRSAVNNSVNHVDRTSFEAGFFSCSSVDFSSWGRMKQEVGRLDQLLRDCRRLVFSSSDVSSFIWCFSPSQLPSVRWRIVWKKPHFPFSDHLNRKSKLKTLFLLTLTLFSSYLSPICNLLKFNPAWTCFYSELSSYWSIFIPFWALKPILI